MTPLYIEYLSIAIFIAFAGGLSVLFAISSWLIGKQLPDSEKLSPYE
jgi:NADH-quinone oxidoreductase subunit A